METVTAEVVRELEEDDLATRGPAPLAGIQKIRDSHHQLARLLAEGRKPVEVAELTGFSQSRISILQRDPAFKELLEFYRGTVAEVFVDVQKRISTLALDALQELHERLHEAPESFGNTQLLELVTRALDRSGHAPISRSQHTIAVLSPADIRQIKEAASNHGLITLNPQLEAAE